MTATPYTVIGHPQSRAMRVIWMLEELGEPYELQPFRPQSDEVRALNPLGKIPVLKEGEAVLTDSVAICTYLADRNGRLTAQAGTLARARQDTKPGRALKLFDYLRARKQQQQKSKEQG